MAEPFVSEIRMFPYSFAPRGWAQCDGQTVPVSENQTLFALIQTIYGGNGQIDFKLPDLRGRTPVHADYSIGIDLGLMQGLETVALKGSEMASHSHQVAATGQPGSSKKFTDQVLAAGDNKGAESLVYTTPSDLTSLHPESISQTGGGHAHTNVQPSSVINFCIAMQGLWPSRN